MSSVTDIHSDIVNTLIKKHKINSDDNNETTSSETSSIDVISSKKRWLILSSYCLLSLSACSAWLCFPAVSNIIRLYYDIRIIHVNMLSIIFGIAIIIVSLPFAVFIERFGLSVGLKLAATLNTIGAVIRYFGYERNFGYWFLLFGNMFTAFAVACFLFLPGKIAAVWFPVKEMVTATAVCIAFDAVGTGVGFLHATTMIENNNDINSTRKDIQHFLFSQLIVSIFSFVFVFLFTKNQPQSNSGFPDLNIDAHESTGQENLLSKSCCSCKKKSCVNCHKELMLVKSKSSKELRYRTLCYAILKLLRNKDFHLIVIIQGITASIEGIYEMLLNEMLVAKFPGSEKLIGIVGFISIILGFFTNILIGLIIDRIGSCKFISFLVFFISTICCIIWTIFMEYFVNILALAIIFCILMSVCTSYYTIAFAHSTQIAASSSPTAIGVLLVLSSQIYDTVVSIVITEILYYFGAFGVNLFAVFLSCTAVIATLFIKGEKKFLKC